mgnify:CR=1 FL=1
MYSEDQALERYEAVYFFSRISALIEDRIPQLKDLEALESFGIHANVFHATTKILVVNDLLSIKKNVFTLSEQQRHLHQKELSRSIDHNLKAQCIALFEVAMLPRHFFFHSLSALEYEIYSKHNFQITYRTGERLVEHIDLANQRVLEIGGNSGGLATAILKTFRGCHYTILDTPIPCDIGNLFKVENQVDLRFVAGDMFDIALPPEPFDTIVLMNILHDFDDGQCGAIISQCLPYCHTDTRFLIVEDLLFGDYEPKVRIMHGLRLAVACRGGKQRTIDEFNALFLAQKLKVERTVDLCLNHTMLEVRVCRS